MKILVINCGSSSLKYQLINMEDESVICKGICERIGIEGSFIKHEANGGKWTVEVPFPTHTEAFAKVVEMMTTGEGKVINDVKEVSAIGHRVAHGAESFKESTLVDDEVIAEIGRLGAIAPLHNPAHVLGLNSAKSVFGADVPNVVVFDTVFHATMPRKAYMYAVPYEWYEDHKVRRYGFHGTSHKFVSLAAAEFLGKKPEELKIVTCHLGNGSSIAAVDGGKVVDTSMGFSPLAGLLMGTRSGDVDPSVAAFIAEKTGMNGSELSVYLNKKGGFLGVSGISSDCRDLEIAAEEGNDRAALTLEMLVYQIQKFIGSYTAAMNGVDVIAFTAGIGENSAFVRENVMAYLGYLGVTCDKEENAKREDIHKISTADSKVLVYSIATNEELAIARETYELTK